MRITHYNIYGKIKGNSRKIWIKKLGSIPGAIDPAGLFIGIKTRTLNSKGPLHYLQNVPSYLSQSQLQIAYIDASFCILLSDHPITESGNFFLIQNDNALVDVIMGVCNFSM